MTQPIDRNDAVKKIAGHLADRDAFVVTAGPGMVAEVGRRMACISGWTAYLDSGIPAVMRTSVPGALVVIDALVSSALVLIVPKVVPAVKLGKALGKEIAADGSQDIVILCEDQAALYHPMLFVDALAIVDPAAAAHFHANDLANLS